MSQEKNMSSVTLIKPTKSRIQKRLRVAAYARVSVEKTASENSIISQIQHFRSLIEANPIWINVGLYSDLGISGTKNTRPGFMQLIKDCKEGKIDIILTKSISRFARNTVDLLDTTRNLKDLGINVWFERENLWSISEEGELMITLLASFAQEEARSMSENMIWSIRKGFEKGIGNWSHLYGYHYESHTHAIIESEAETIQLIFSLYLSGNGPHAIANELNRRNLKRRCGKPFTYNSVVKILSQEKYFGHSYLQKTFRENYITKKKMINKGVLPVYFATDTNPSIVDQSLFRDLQETKAKRRQLGFRAGQEERFSCFTEKIICASCGHTYRRCNKGGRWKRFIWRCGTKITKGAGCCAAQNLPEKLLKESVCSVLQLHKFDPDAVENKIKQIVVSHPNTLEFKLTDGRSVIRHWTYDDRTKTYTEVKDGDYSYNDPAYTDDVLIKAVG